MNDKRISIILALIFFIFSLCKDNGSKNSTPNTPKFFTLKEAIDCCYKLCGNQDFGCGESCEGGGGYELLRYGWLPTENEIRNMESQSFPDVRNQIKRPPPECLKK